MPRYLSGLALAFFLTGVVIAATIVPMTMLAGRRPSLKTVLLSFWTRMPMELVLGFLPYALAGALFAGWIVGGQTAGRRWIASDSGPLPRA